MVCILLSTFYSIIAQDIIVPGGTYYRTEVSGNASNGNVAPFWFSANKFGLSSIEPNSGYLRAGIFRTIDSDSTSNWHYGYGIDVAVPLQFTSSFILQQAYSVLQYKNALLTLGAKEIPSEMLNPDLSSGGLTLSSNYRPIPQIRIETPNWWKLHFTNDWVSLKAHIAFGAYTDGEWQKDFAVHGSMYSEKSLFHSKSGYIRVGRDNVDHFSCTFGLQMACQFGGEAYNIMGYRPTLDEPDRKFNIFNGFKSFWNAFIPGGSDVNDGDYKNVEGNHSGNYYFDLAYKTTNWNLRAYAQHYFDDHSQMFLEYGLWKDMLLGIEAQLPRNPFINNVVVEYLRTDDQTGGLYHDHTENLPDQISGKDDYYNHHVYGAWQHWGQAVGTPFCLSPIYNSNGKLNFYHNRVKALHIGLEGNPLRNVNYRILYSYLKSLGSYDYPTVDPMYQNYFLGELSYHPDKMKGWAGKISVAFNQGDIIPNSTGFSFSISKTGKLF